MFGGVAGVAFGAVIAIVNILTTSASPTAATLREGGYALAPFSFLKFCLDYPSDCPKSAGPGRIRLASAHMAELTNVNRAKPVVAVWARSERSDARARHAQSSAPPPPRPSGSMALATADLDVRRGAVLRPPDVTGLETAAAYAARNPAIELAKTASDFDFARSAAPRSPDVVSLARDAKSAAVANAEQMAQALVAEPPTWIAEARQDSTQILAALESPFSARAEARPIQPPSSPTDERREATTAILGGLGLRGFI
jgi:hypothetical protein